MKKFFISLFVLGISLTSLKAQWQPTGNLLGGNGVDISAVAVNDSTIFAGGPDGIFISTNDGTTWTASNTGLTNHLIESFGINGNSIFAGMQMGISRSTNNGSTWQTVFNLPTGYIRSFASIGSKIFAANIVSADSIYLSTDNGTSWHSRSLNVGSKLAIKDTILFASGSDVYKSTDYGISWTHTNLYRYVWSLAVKDTIIFAGCNDGIYIYSNNDNNWTKCSINFLTTYPDVTALGISSSGAIIAYCTEGFYKSTDSGVSWNLVSTDITDNVVTAIVAHGSNLFAGISYGGGVYRSTDDGINWTAKISGMLPIITSLAVRNSVLTAGSNTGRIFFSSDSGESWVPADTGFSGQHVWSLIVGGTKLYAGTGQGVFVASNYYGTDWLPINNGLTNTQVLSLAFENIGTGNINFFAGTYGSGVFLSTNNGNNWTAANTGIENSIVWALAVTDSNIFAGIGLEGISHSIDNGTSWTSANTGLTNADVRCFTQCDSFIFAGTWGSGVYRTSKNDISWVSVNSGLTDLNVLSLYTIDTTIFASTYNGVFLSTDFGISWIAFNSGLENMDAWSFNILGEYVYAGTCTGGVMKRPLSEIVVPVELKSFTASTNGKEVILNWSTATELNNRGFEIQRSTEGIEFLTVGFVKGHGTTTERQNYSYADKNLNNGKYYYRLKQVDYDGSYEYSDVVEIEWRVFNSYLLEQNFPNPFNPTTTIGFGIQNKSNVKITVLNVIGEEVAVILNEEREPGYYKVEFNAANLPSGVYFYRMQAGSFVQTKKMILLK